jgi:hypothetical protein
MDLKRMVILAGWAMITLTAGQAAFAQEMNAVSDSVLITNQQSVSKEGEMQWAWGEVTALDAQAKTITLKYLDYETDQEKDLVLAVDDKTTFENVKDLDELKVKDTLSIDYVVGTDNRNLAKNVSLEKPDDSSVSAVESSVPAQPAPTSTVPAENASGTVTDASQVPMTQEPAPTSTPVQEPAPTSTPVQEPAPVPAQ